MFQATITYALMLIAMLVLLNFPVMQAPTFYFLCRTFQVAYFVSIIAGLGVGEVMFGRFGSVVSHH
jgi:hypothetical protein